jgi:hypothetical protein
MLCLSFSYSQSIGFLGDFSGWGDDIDMTTTDNTTYTKSSYYLPAGDIKFREGNNWNGNQWPSSGNYNVANAGFYDISLNSSTWAINLTSLSSGSDQNISLIGDFNSWSDTAMSTTDNITYTLDAVSISAGNVKFRRDSGWECNWGDTATADGTADPNSGDNIAIATNNTYDVSFNLSTLAYTFTVSTTASINNIALKDLVNIYYDSSMGTLNVSIESIQEKLAYRIYTIGGRIIGDGHLFRGANKLSCDALSSGLYILDVVDTSSKERAIKKFIKH